MTRIVLEGEVNADQVDTEDGGSAMIAEIEGGDEAEGFFVRLQSWDTTKQHATFKAFVGHRVRVTVEIIEPVPEAAIGDVGGRDR